MKPPFWVKREGFAALALVASTACAETPPPRCPEPIAAAPAPDPAPAPEHGAHHHGGPLVRRFEEAEDWAKRFEGPERDAYQRPEVVVQAMELGDGMRVADIGAGTGYFLPHLSRAVAPSGQVVAVDIEAAMVRYMIVRSEREGLANVMPRLGAVDDPLFHAGSLDRVLIVNTWHHIPDRDAYAEKLAQSLLAGGQVWIVDFKLESSRGPAREHKIEPKAAAANLASAGLEVRIDHELLPDQYVVVGEKKLEGG